MRKKILFYSLILLLVTTVSAIFGFFIFHRDNDNYVTDAIEVEYEIFSYVNETEIVLDYEDDELEEGASVYCNETMETEFEDFVANDSEETYEFLGFLDGRRVIYGDITYNGLSLPQIFLVTFFDILGEPLDYDGNVTFFYESFQVRGDGTMYWFENLREEGEEFVVTQLNAWQPYLHLFEIDGIILDMTESELIEVFGATIYTTPNLRQYRIITPTIILGISFHFDPVDPDEPDYDRRVIAFHIWHHHIR